MATLPVEAKDWLIACLDPYHDNQMRLEGLPDMVSAPSVVKMHNQSYTLTAPASAVADWDATVAFTGCSTEIGNCPGMVRALVGGAVAGDDWLATYDHTAYSLQDQFGSFVIKAGASAAPLVWGAPFTLNDTNTAFGAMELAPASDRGRIIAVAFEITNTTADIYKQGSITVAQLPSAVNDYGTVFFRDTNGAPYQDSVFQTWYSPKFAASRDALIGVPGAATWAARDGVYAIPRMVTHTMPVENPDLNKRVAIVQDSSSDTTYYTSTPYNQTTASGISRAYCHGVGSSGFGAIQVFLNGLSHETSLTITMRTIVEYFPSFNSALLPLTHPSPAFCPKVFEMYSKVARIAPYAVPVKENSVGEYFRRLLALLGKAGQAVAPAFGEFAPVVAGIGKGAVYLADGWSRQAQKMQEERQRAATKKKALPAPPPRVRRDEAGARGMVTRR